MTGRKQFTSNFGAYSFQRGVHQQALDPWQNPLSPHIVRCLGEFHHLIETLPGLLPAAGDDLGNPEEFFFVALECVPQFDTVMPGRFLARWPHNSRELATCYTHR